MKLELPHIYQGIFKNSAGFRTFNDAFVKNLLLANNKPSPLCSSSIYFHTDLFLELNWINLLLMRFSLWAGNSLYTRTGRSPRCVTGDQSGEWEQGASRSADPPIRHLSVWWETMWGDEKEMVAGSDSGPFSSSHRNVEERGAAFLA